MMPLIHKALALSTLWLIPLLLLLGIPRHGAAAPPMEFCEHSSPDKQLKASKGKSSADQTGRTGPDHLPRHPGPRRLQRHAGARRQVTDLVVLVVAANDGVMPQTLEALSRLDYPHYEVLVMDNNTKDPAVWEPVRDDCERLGEKFRFFHLENWPGFKAGAINHALEQTAPDAEIIAVVDSDYILSPDWLKCMVPYFENENDGFVQSRLIDSGNRRGVARAKRHRIAVRRDESDAVVDGHRLLRQQGAE